MIDPFSQLIHEGMTLYKSIRFLIGLTLNSDGRQAEAQMGTLLKQPPLLTEGSATINVQRRKCLLIAKACRPVWKVLIFCFRNWELVYNLRPVCFYQRFYRQSLVRMRFESSHIVRR
jgi:hypothetical protein